MYKSIIFFLSNLLLFTACSSKNEDLVKEPNKDGSIETVINVAHENGFEILKTTHKIWIKGNVDKVIESADTLKTLEIETKKVKDENGNEQEVMAPKDYELYITVK